MVYITAHN